MLTRNCGFLSNLFSFEFKRCTIGTCLTDCETATNPKTCVTKLVVSSICKTKLFNLGSRYLLVQHGLGGHIIDQLKSIQTITSQFRDDYACHSTSAFAIEFLPSTGRYPGISIGAMWWVPDVYLLNSAITCKRGWHHSHVSIVLLTIDRCGTCMSHRRTRNATVKHDMLFHQRIDRSVDSVWHR